MTPWPAIQYDCDAVCTAQHSVTVATEVLEAGTPPFAMEFAAIAIPENQ